MKKEWMYFIAGLALMAAVLSFSILKDTSADCVAVAKYLTKGKGNLIVTVEEVDLTDHEKQLADYMKKRRTGHWEYVPAYVTCLKIEEGRI